MGTDDVIRNINDTFINNANVSDLAADQNAVAVGVMAIDECASSDARSTCNSTFAECSATTSFPGFLYLCPPKHFTTRELAAEHACAGVSTPPFYHRTISNVILSNVFLVKP